MNLQRHVNERLLQAASRAREEGIADYAIAQGSPNHSQPWKQPDVQLLVEMANVPSGANVGSGLISRKTGVPSRSSRKSARA